MEPLPGYVEDQLPQNAFDALLTRIASPATTLRHPNARVILESYVEGQRAQDHHLDDATNLVTANTTNQAGLTPLLAAIASNVMPIVTQLLALGADPNAFGVIVSVPSEPFSLLIIVFVTVCISAYSINACCKPRVAPYREAAV